MQRAASRRGCLCLAFLLLHVLGQVAGTEHCATLCPASCPEKPVCASGVPVIQDLCGCCSVCARQRGENCSDLAPCQEGSGLFCDRSADPSNQTGICVEGDNCVFAGVVYQTGVTFQPSCHFQCTCHDGQVACVHRCFEDVLMPGPECPVPRKVKVAGECCEKWVCDTNENLTVPAYTSEDTYLPDGEIVTDTIFNCIEQTTEWSACSKTCGVGISTRVTNNNENCEMQKETRYCMVRPCGKEFKLPKLKKGKKCHRSVRAPKSINLQFENCTSVETFRPRYCGTCIDGRCCTPDSTSTLFTDFVCFQGGFVKKPVMQIHSCSCHTNCPRDSPFF